METFDELDVFYPVVFRPPFTDWQKGRREHKAFGDTLLSKPIFEEMDVSDIGS